MTLLMDKFTPNKRFYLRGSAFFALINLVVVWGIATRYLPFFNAPSDPWGIAYLVTTWIGHFGLLVMLAWLPMALAALVLPRKAMIPVMSLIAAAGLWALALDTVVFSQYRFHVNHFMLSLFVHDQNGEIFSFSASTWALGIGVIVGLLLFETWLAWRIQARAQGIAFPVWKTFLGLLIMAIASHAIHVVADAQYKRSVTQQTSIYPLLFPATAKDFMEKNGWLDPRAAREKNLSMNRAHDSGSLNWPAKPLSCTPGDTPPNVVVIALDSWRFDEYGPKTTPHLYQALNESGLRFEHHISSGNATRNGVFGLFYGLTGNYWNTMEDSQTGSLFIRTLQQENYRLGLFGSASFDGVGFDRTVFSSVPDLRLRTHEGEDPAARDKNMTKDWLDWQTKRRTADAGQPYFGFLFYDAPHGYSVPDDAERPWQPSLDTLEYTELGPDTDPIPVRNLHRNAAHYDDQLIKRVIDDLKAHGEWDNTYLIVTSDHGQSFNDTGHSFWGHNSNFSRYQTQVPLLIHGPNVQPGTHKGMTSHLDVVPTLMKHALGCANPPADYSQGKDLLDPTLDHPWVIANSYLGYAIIEKDRITEVKDSGDWVTYDPELNTLDQEQFSPAVFEAVNLMGRFYD
ncbi:DUF3413 domain-containing protein [Larsenimonas suaedae]|uniref:DUF3413 domain-containing protein n=1 Tax=Larsenimonas suaedae TaxID=1851019 RepID=A0ABU1GRB4_9GAMM|nr:DUF3413 domain-containing protein [Larsenimonas suaedae]MCM2972669.1 DUF3413 domain-containing protein [Larsenimonas suaedae]MDR5894534.1 DUF3413 domain-containing protein [Larsenimonas suaedae]